MEEKPAPPRLPPLPYAVLKEVEEIENYLSKSIEGCRDQFSFNNERAARLLRTCAVEVFQIESAHYSQMSNLHPDWITELAEQIISICLGLVQTGGFAMLSAKPDLELLENGARSALQTAIAKLKTQSPSGSTLPSLPFRNTLRESYLRRFPEAKILDICWAAGQHYSEWKRWLHDKVKDGSAPDRAFRALLSSGKAPSEYRKQTRPDGWK
jgi:hypothetical protein